MILDKFLNESKSISIEPLFESYIQGEDINEIYMMTEDFNRNNERLDEGVMLAESLAFICEQKGNYDNARVLQEGAVIDFFKKLKENLTKLWQRVKAFFVNLFKSIQVEMGNINKSLENIDKYLDKDFSKFAYDGHKWSTNPSIQTTISNKAKEAIKGIKNLVDKQKNNSTKAREGDNSLGDNENGIIGNDHGVSLKKATASMVGQSGELTLEEAKDKIKAHWGYTTSTDSIKNFSVISKGSMIQFLKDFSKNKILIDLKNETDETFKESINAISDAQNLVERLKPKEDAKEDEQTKSKNTISNAVTNIKSLSNQVMQVISAYDKLMSECIACEKAKFSEYRNTLAAAVRYKPSK